VNVVVCLHAPAAPPISGRAISRADHAALEQALALSAREPGHTVTALVAGTAAQAGPLVEALAAGADRAVRIPGDDLLNADFHSFGQLFASAIKRVGADLVLAGMGGSHEGLEAVPASTARQLGLVHVSGIEAIANAPRDPNGGAAVDVVVRGGGRKRRLRVSLPALLSVAVGPGAISPPRPRTAEPEIEVLSVVDPERTLVRRRTELLGSPEPIARTAETVSSGAAFVAALRAKPGQPAR
jgi:electron transfer flavoprotein alpha/beta subunit